MQGWRDGSASRKARFTTIALILMGRDVDYFGAISSNNRPETQASVLPNSVFQHGRSFTKILYFYRKIKVINQGKFKMHGGVCQRSRYSEMGSFPMSRDVI